jgi:O-antigen/teichoic acid export membrane protein
LFDRKFRYNIVQTGLVQVFSMASFVILLVFVLPRFISKPDLGLYVTFRALVASLFPLYTVALDIAQARYLGYHTGDPDEQKSVTSTVLIVFFIVAIISTGLIFPAKPFILKHFFDGNISIFYALMTALVFSGTYRISYTFFQGHKKMEVANILQSAIFIFGNLIAAILISTGAISGITQIVWFVALLPGLSIFPFIYILATQWVKIFDFRKILVYALPRVPHLFMTGLMMSSAVMLAKYFYSSALAGDFGIATRFFQLAGTLAYAFNMVLLPGVSELWGKGDKDELASSLSRYADLVVGAGTVAIFVFYAMGPFAIRWFLPSQYESGIPILQILAFAALPYLFYLMFRSIIHGVDTRPVQVVVDLARGAVLLGVFAVLTKFYPDSPAVVISIALALSHLTAGISSYSYITRRIGFHGRLTLWGIHLALVLGLVLMASFFPVPAIILFSMVETGIVWHFFRNWRGKSVISV